MAEDQWTVSNSATPPPAPPAPPQKAGGWVVSDKPTPPKPVVAAVPHDQASPPEPPSLADRASAVRDRVINYLVRPRDTGTGTGAERILTQEDPIAYAGRTGVGSVASMVMHPYDSAKAFARQAAEAPTALASSFMTDKMLQQAKAQGYDTSRIEKARADTLDQLKSMGHEITHDPARFVGEQVAQALFFHALGDTAGLAKMHLSGAAKDALTRSGKAILSTAPVDTAETVRGISEKNTEAVADAANKNKLITEKNQKAADKHAQDLADVKAENEAKEKRVAELNAKRLATHLKKIDKVQADNADLETAARDRTENAQAKIDDAHAAAEKAAVDATEADTKRGQLATDEIKTRQQLMKRVQTNYAATKARIDAAFDNVRRKVNNVDAKDAEAQKMFGQPAGTSGEPAPKITYDSLKPEQRAQVDAKAPTPTTPVAPLVDAVTQASEEFKGSAEKQKIFNDILTRAKDTGGLDELKEQIAKGHFGATYKDLTPQQVKLVDDVAGEEHERYVADRGSEEAANQGIDFDHLRGYSSELGRAIDDSIHADGPGDIRRALFKVKERVDAMAQHLANDADAGGNLKTAKQHWHIFKSVYEEPTGPSSSGSPVAQSVNAGQAFPSGDAFHATEPFLKETPELASRARQLAVGRKFTDPYFDPKIGDLIDRLRRIKAQQDKLPKAEKTAAAIAAKPTEPPATVAHQPAKPKELPEPKEPLVAKPKKEPTPPEQTPPVIAETTPVTFDEIKQRNIKTIQTKLKSYRNVSVYRVAEMAAGTVSVVSGIAALMTHAAGMGVAAESLGLASGGAFLFALGPRLLANMLDSPKVIEQLATPTIADYAKVMKMPAEQRAGFESAVTQIAAAAKKAGKLKKPSPWISFFANVATAAGAVNKPAREQGQKQDQQQQQQLDIDTMKDADEALRLANEQSRVTAPGNPAATVAAGRYLHTATHKQTGHRIGSNDNGRSWHDLNTGAVFNG